MTKKEIIERLTNLNSLLKQPRDEFIAEMNSKTNAIDFSNGDYYPLLVGMVKGCIEIILQNEVE